MLNSTVVFCFQKNIVHVKAYLYQVYQLSIKKATVSIISISIRLLSSEKPEKSNNKLQDVREEEISEAQQRWF